jgi:hypothetical protein
VRAAGPVALAFALGCGGPAEPAGTPIEPDAGITTSPEIVFGIGEGVFPHETLIDWVSYAVQVSEVTVASESEIPPPPAVLERREGYIGRRARFRVERTFWKSPGAITPGATPDPAEVEIVVVGWVLHDGVRRRMAFRNSPRMEVGGRYVMPMVTLLRPKLGPDGRSTGEQEARWSPLDPESPFAFGGDPVATADAQLVGVSPLSSELSTLSAEALAERLASTPPARFVDQFWHLPPRERLRAVQEAQQNADPATRR